MLAVPLQRLLRRRLERHSLHRPEVFEAIERALREGALTQLLALTPEERALQRLLARLDPAELRRAYGKAHRACVRAAEQPVRRSYVLGGQYVNHDIRNIAEWHAYIDGDYQKGVRELMLRFSGRDSTVADIGANVGIFTLPVARHVSAGRVYAFEPNPTTRACLEEAVHANGLEERVVLERLALSSAEGTVELVIPADNAGAAAIARVPHDQAGDTVAVVARTFDSWWKSVGEPEVSVIKIDVEGHEPDVLEGMQEYLAKAKPVLILEVSPELFGAPALFERLEAGGYSLFKVEDSYPYFAKLDKSARKLFNLLAVPSGRVKELKSGGL